MHWPALTFRRQRGVAWLAILVVAWGGALAACQSTRAVSEMNAATHTQETVELLEGGVARVGLRAARRNVAAWETRLRSEDDDALDDIADALDDLEAELGTTKPDRLTMGRILGRLGEQTRTAARREEAPARLGQLGDLLVEAGARLREAEESP